MSAQGRNQSQGSSIRSQHEAQAFIITICGVKAAVESHTQPPTYRTSQYLIPGDANIANICAPNGMFWPSSNCNLILHNGLLHCNGQVSRKSSSGVSIERCPRSRVSGYQTLGCYVYCMDVKLGVPSAEISWCTLKIPLCSSRRVGEQSLAVHLSRSLLIVTPMQIT